MSINLDENQCRLINGIIEKLRKLKCPLIFNNLEEWVQEILVLKDSTMYRLIDWIFLKFEWLKESSLENNEVTEESVIALFSAMIYSGVVSRADAFDIVKGLAPVKKQLQFWEKLVESLWKKCSFNTKSKETMTNQYIAIADYIDELCGYVNMKHLFRENLNLFPGDVLKEFKEYESYGPKLETLEELKTLTKEKQSKQKEQDETLKPFKASSKIVMSFMVDFKALKPYKLGFKTVNYCKPEFKALKPYRAGFKTVKLPYKAGVKTLKPYDENNMLEVIEEVDEEEPTLYDLEDEMSSALRDLQDHTKVELNNAYENLNVYLNVQPDESIDFGPLLQTAEVNLRRFLELKKAWSTLISSESELNSLNRRLQSFAIQNQPLTDSLLQEYSGIMKMKNEKKK